MSVIQRIREKAAWFVFGAIALSLLAFILQDALTRKGGGMFRNTSTVGKINGVSIDKTDFDNKLSFYEQANGSQRTQLIGSVWEYIVDQTVMQQEYNKLGLRYTSKEQSDEWFSDNPPPVLQQIFGDKTTGAYNVEQARQFFSQMKKTPNDPRVSQITPYLEQAIQQSLRQKYQSMITGAVYVPKWLAEKTNADNNSIARISYVTVPYTTVSDSTVKVTDDEIEAYVKKHAKRFEQKEETRQISYVSFDASPSKDDTLAVLSQLEQLKPQFAAATDEKSFLAKNGTETPFYNGYINKNEIKQKVNDSSLFKLSPGEVYGPYIDANNYVLAKMIDVKQLPDSVIVRHILVSTHQQQEQGGALMRIRDDSAARKRLDSAVALINSGSNFDSVCAKYSDDPGSKDKGGVYDYFTSGRMVEEFNDFAFIGKTGDKKVVQTSYGFHYIEILGQKGSSPAYKIAYLSKPITASQETINAANAAATQFSAKNRESVRWIYDNKVGDVSEPFEVNGNYVVAIITAINKPGLMNAHAARQTVEPIVRNDKKANQIINAKIKGNTLDAIAKSAGASVQRADTISFQAFVIPNVGNEIKIIGAAFNKQLQNKVSTSIASSTGVFVIRGEGVYATSSLSSNPTMLRQTLETQMKSQVGYASLNALRQAANVKDYRSTFY